MVAFISKVPFSFDYFALLYSKHVFFFFHFVHRQHRKYSIETLCSLLDSEEAAQEKRN